MKEVEGKEERRREMGDRETGRGSEKEKERSEYRTEVPLRI